MLGSTSSAPAFGGLAARTYRSVAISEDALVEEHLSLVKTTVDRMRVFLPPTLEMDDLYSVGVTGLMTAARRFDPAQNGSFPAFASMHIRGQVHDELRRMDWVPRSLRDKAKRFKVSVTLLENNLGRPATELEICKELNLSTHEYESLMEELKPATILPLDGEAYTENSDNISLHDLIADDTQPSVAGALEQKDLFELVLARIQQLPDMQKKVLAMYYFEEMRLSEIAAAFGVTEGRISQIHTQAVLGLRGYMEKCTAG
jgi:RNA polymerase sigma factor FliA